MGFTFLLGHGSIGGSGLFMFLGIELDDYLGGLDGDYFRAGVPTWFCFVLLLMLHVVGFGLVGFSIRD